MKEQIEKQAIEELYEQIKYSTGSYDSDARSTAEIIVNDMGYRKQIVGEWVMKSNGYMVRDECSVCHMGEDWRTPYCPNCGARMKGGAE